MKQAAVSPNNTFGLTEQVDHIVAECQEDEYRVKTLLHSSAILTQQHQAKMEQGKEASGAGWRSVFNRVPECTPPLTVCQSCSARTQLPLRLG